MNIIVLLKQTFDTEEKIIIENGQIKEDGVKFVINPYDEYAVEEAIRIREEHGGIVKIVSVGSEKDIEALRTALAMGADEAVLISKDNISLDGYSVSESLAGFLAQQNIDIILGGNFSVDQGEGQVAIRVASILDIPHVASITKLNIADGKATVHRDAEGDIEVIEVPLPALFTAQQGLNEPRYPSLPGIMKAKKKPLEQLSLDDLKISPLKVKTKRFQITLPLKRNVGRILEGKLEEQAKELIHLLHNEDKVI